MFKINHSFLYQLVAILFCYLVYPVSFSRSWLFLTFFYSNFILARI